MWVLLAGYPIMVGVMVGLGSQELLAKFGPIISTGALCCSAEVYCLIVQRETLGYIYIQRE
jgi:hypothetical protein